jgi:phosphoglycolate phosphatase
MHIILLQSPWSTILIRMVASSFLPPSIVQEDLALPALGTFLKDLNLMIDFKAIVFDLDGTLIDSLEDIALAANQVLSQMGFPEHSVEAYKTFVGDGVNVLMHRILPSGVDVDAVSRDFLLQWKDAYAKQWQINTRPYEGILPLVNRLKDQGYRLGVLSNKPHEFTVACVQALFPESCFDAVWGLTEGRAKKPDPAAALEMVRQWDLEPRDILYVGDTDTDMLTAVNAGFYALGVTWGFRSAEELMGHGARETIDLPEQLEWLLGGVGKERD